MSAGERRHSAARTHHRDPPRPVTEALTEGADQRRQPGAEPRHAEPPPHGPAAPPCRRAPALRCAPPRCGGRGGHFVAGGASAPVPAPVRCSPGFLRAPGALLRSVEAGDALSLLIAPRGFCSRLSFSPRDVPAVMLLTLYRGISAVGGVASRFKLAKGTLN